MHRLNGLAALACCLTTLVSNLLVARDDGRFANSPLKEWFDPCEQKRIVLRFC
jgi:hypothetical protein